MKNVKRENGKEMDRECPVGDGGRRRTCTQRKRKIRHLYVQETEWRGSIEYGKGKGGEAALNMAGLIRLWNIVYCCIKGRILI